MLEGKHREQFERLSTTGQAAKNAGEHELALKSFEEADRLAIDYHDSLKRMHTLTPAARALWSLQRFTEASKKLEAASRVASELGLSDERAITISNIGRIASTEIISTILDARQTVALKAKAVPRFQEAYELLKGDPHLYYRYANAQHGSVVAAIVGDRRLASRLIVEGARVAFRRSEQPYDQKHTYKVNPRGLVQLLSATALIPFGKKTPLLSRYAREKLIR
jgi:tetratricopeptide (TPR) repeat protein